MKYKTIRPYHTYIGCEPITIPPGTLIEYWAERGFYLSHAVNNCCVAISKWAVEAWRDYFEQVTG